eukprot:1403876-Prymnesium_polylepis.1
MEAGRVQSQRPRLSEPSAVGVKHLRGQRRIAQHAERPQTARGAAKADRGLARHRDNGVLEAHLFGEFIEALDEDAEPAAVASPEEGRNVLRGEPYSDALTRELAAVRRPKHVCDVTG